MAKVPPSPNALASLPERMDTSSEKREIFIPYDPAAGPVTAVKNLVLQASLQQLQEHGYFERYRKLIAPAALEQLVAAVGPGWSPVRLALQHYEACDNLLLSPEEITTLGRGVGTRVQDANLVSATKRTRLSTFDPWKEVASLHRMWPRQYQGGTARVVRLSQWEALLEQRGLVLTSIRYFRYGLLTAISTAFEALGSHHTSMKIVNYSPVRDELSIQMTWPEEPDGR